MEQWLKSIAISICIITIVIQLLPQNQYVKYVKFYGSLMILLVTAGPLINLVSEETVLIRSLKEEFIREELGEMERTVDNFVDLKKVRILEKFETEIEQQIQELAVEEGINCADAKISFSSDEEFGIQKIDIWIRQGNKRDDQKELEIGALGEKVKEIYGSVPVNIETVSVHTEGD